MCDPPSYKKPRVNTESFFFKSKRQKTHETNPSRTRVQFQSYPNKALTHPTKTNLGPTHIQRSGYVSFEVVSHSNPDLPSDSSPNSAHRLQDTASATTSTSVRPNFPFYLFFYFYHLLPLIFFFFLY